MSMEILEGTHKRKLPCSSCPFIGGYGEAKIGTVAVTEYRVSLLSGCNHLCHSDPTNKTICRGGRDFQLQVFHRLGIIENPTDEALAEAMRKCGVEPKEHI